MKSLRTYIRKVLVAILTLEARLVLRKYRPRIVAITGSVGKTSTKDAIGSVLDRHFFVRKSEKSFNSEIGVPLTVLGAANAWSDMLRWARVCLEGFGLILLPNHYPRWLVLEVGADRPGDIKSLSSWITSEIVVITRFPDVPVHIEYFKSGEEVATEKQHLIKTLTPEGTLVLNADDRAVLGSAALFHGNVITYGFSEGAHVRATHENVLYEKGAPVGMGFRIEYRGSSVPCEIHGALGKSHISGALAAAAVGLASGVNLVDAAQDLKLHIPPPGRLRILPGLSGSTLIDDTYNSSPAAAEVAIETLQSIETKGKRIAVLGDMLELGSHSVEAHKELGAELGKGIDHLYAVGIRARDIAESAQKAGLSSSAITIFANSKEGAEVIPKEIAKGDIVLIKGSQSIRLERVTGALLAPGIVAKDVLVRQEAEWLAR